MLFNSMAFAIFLPVVFLLYWICPSRYRWTFLLAVSYYFYMSMDVKYAVLLLFTTAVSYAAARLMEKKEDRRYKRLCLAGGAAVLLGLLFALKYLNFFFEILGGAAQLFAIPMQAPTVKLMLPVGISFYTFTTLGYLIDVYRGKYAAEKHFGYYSLFVSFFPQLLSGPIARGDILLPQLRKERSFDSAQAAYGVKLMAVGYFKKLVVANMLVSTVNKVYDRPDIYVGLVFLVVTVMFAIQIYCDFSGYTDIAIGAAKLFGIDLSENFKSPYFSHSIKEFWSRWHISLSTWFRDYVYIPLGGNRVGGVRRCFNLMVTFLVSGLWHGASLTYIVWGGIHGFYQIVETLLFRKKKERRGFFSLFFTFLAVCLAWVFFRANTLADAWRIITYIPFDIANFENYIKTLVICLDMDYSHMIYLCMPVLLLAVYDFASLKTDVLVWISNRKAWIRYPVYILFLVVILLFAEKGVSTDFYYFQF